MITIEVLNNQFNDTAESLSTLRDLLHCFCNEKKINEFDVLNLSATDLLKQTRLIIKLSNQLK